MAHTILTCVTLLAALILLASAYSDLISPTVWIVAAYLGLFFPVFLVADIMGLIFLLATKHWKLSFILMGAFLICGPTIWRYCPLNIFDREPITNVMEENGVEKMCPIDTFRVMTFNTRALGDAKVWRDNAEVPIIDMVRDCGADVVCLQEYTYSKEKKSGYQEEDLRRMLKKQYPYYHLLQNSNDSHMGVVVFSKWPLRVSEKIDKQAKNYCWASYHELDVRGRRIALVNCHLQNQAISKENRSLIKSQLKHLQKDSLMKIDNGLRELIPSFRNRTVQTATINKYLQARRKNWHEPMPLLICGDMNDTPTSFAYRSMRGDLDDSWQEAGFGPGISYREAPFWFRIDHIFHSKHFRVLDVKVLRDMKYSDHYPVMATFQLLPYEE